MVVRDDVPVVPPQREDRWPAGSPGGAVNVVYLGVGDAEIIAERPVAKLRVTQLGLGHHGNPLVILERLDVVGVDARFVPLVAIERRVLAGVAHHLDDPLENGLIPVGGVHRLTHRKPVLRIPVRQVIRVVTGGKTPLFHSPLPVATTRPPSGGRVRQRAGAGCRRSRRVSNPDAGSRPRPSP